MKYPRNSAAKLFNDGDYSCSSASIAGWWFSVQLCSYKTLRHENYMWVFLCPDETEWGGWDFSYASPELEHLSSNVTVLNRNVWNNFLKCPYSLNPVWTEIWTQQRHRDLNTHFVPHVFLYHREASGFPTHKYLLISETSRILFHQNTCCSLKVGYFQKPHWCL